MTIEEATENYQRVMTRHEQVMKKYGLDDFANAAGKQQERSMRESTAAVMEARKQLEAVDNSLPRQLFGKAKYRAV